MLKKAIPFAIMSVFILAACSSKAVHENEAPAIICESHYEAPAGSGFNLLEWINISRGTSKGKTHVSMRGTLDNAIPGDYKVMLTAYDDDGNIAIRNLSVTITEPLPEPETSKEESGETPEPTPESSMTPEPTPEPTPKSSATPAPTPAPVVSTPAPAPIQTDPYAQAKADCAVSYGTWTEGGCVWPTPTSAPAAPTQGGMPEGGNCWQEGAYTVCEWVYEWEEYED